MEENATCPVIFDSYKKELIDITLDNDAVDGQKVQFLLECALLYSRFLYRVVLRFFCCLPKLA